MTSNGTLRGRLVPDVGELERSVASLGVDHDRSVLVYGDSVRGWGEEGHAAWLLSLLGHPDVTILDGGFVAWASAGGPIAKDGGPRLHGRFAALWHEELIATMREVTQGEQILDVRSAAEFAGATPYGEARGGHIAGARHLDWRLLFDDAGKLLPAAATRGILASAGILSDRSVVAYCTCGVRSAMATVALLAQGVCRVRNYDGSLAEWSSDARAPMER